MNMIKVNNWTMAVVLVAVAAAPVAAQAPRADDGQIKSRQRISTMEGVLERAVMNGADNLLRQMETVLPNAAMLTGPPRVRGFRLEGYGLFFDVEVPGVEMSVAWPLRALLNDTRAASALIGDLKVQLARVSPREREALEHVVRQLEMTLPPAPPQAAARAGAPTVSAASLSPDGGPAVAPPPVAPIDPDVLDDPYKAWTREVKSALMEAMLENSGPLEIGADEWLTVAAQDSAPRDPLVPGSSVDSSIVYLRVKGSDLAEFHARRLTLSEAVMRVEVREY
jgi:hypothetical protein